jgi:DNA-binding response OmpR family regulator
MPGAPAINVLAECERQEIRLVAAQVPTIMLTAREWVRTVSADEVGLLALLSKPIDLDALVETVGQHVARLCAENQAGRAQSQ